ncbi:MAG: hypothetical protein WKG07_46325 [Hymenobacter sp.]
MKYDRLSLIDRLVERGQGERLPEQLAQARRLAVLHEPVAHRPFTVPVVSGFLTAVALAKVVSRTDTRANL